MPRFNWLRGLGPIGAFAANALTFLTMNWPLTMSAFAGLLAAVWAALTYFVLRPSVEAAAGTFLFVLWTCVGILAITDRNRPRLVRSHQDYRYGLTFEGIIPNYLPVNAPIPKAGSLGIAAQFRNFGPGPLRYEIETFEVRLGSRSLPKLKKGILFGFMARGAGRTSSHEAFPPEQLKEFYGQGEIKGTVDLSVVYGAPEGPPIRRFILGMEITVVLPEDGSASFGWGTNIVTDRDEPISNP